MTRKHLWRAVLIAVLSGALVLPAFARPRLLNQNGGGGFKKLGEEITIGIVVVSVAVGVLVTVLILHYKSRKRAITGCVSSGVNGMSIMDDRDKRAYLLSGDTAAVKPGDRMTLEGKPKHTGKTLVFESQKVTRDFGACHS
jgi:hypothetical protein